MPLPRFEMMVPYHHERVCRWLPRSEQAPCCPVDVFARLGKWCAQHGVCLYRSCVQPGSPLGGAPPVVFRHSASDLSRVVGGVACGLLRAPPVASVGQGGASWRHR